MRIRYIWQPLLYSFPVQLLFLHLKKNTWIVVLWLILFSIILQNMGEILGIPYLFLDPEYRHEVSVWSLLIMGISFGGFIISFQIACYIIDAHRFSFLGNVSKPFSKFALNNSILPVSFIITYLIRFAQFQLANNYNNDRIQLTWQIVGFIGGLLAAILPMSYYFSTTNQDVLKILAKNVNNTLKSPKIRRVNVMKTMEVARYNKVRVDNFLDWGFRIKQADSVLQDLGTALKVLRQNHINAFLIECFVFLQILLVGVFRDNPSFQIPAAASIILLFTLIILFFGAIALWIGHWATPVLIIVFFIANVITQKEWFEADYKAFGLDYSREHVVPYTLDRVRQLSTDSLYKQDYDSTVKILERWKQKVQIGNKKPKMVLICSSGGGHRSAAWVMRSLQFADSTLHGNLMKHTVLMTGASGGLVGAGYFRELYRRKLKDSTINIYQDKYFRNIAKDNLNYIALTLVVSDLLFKTRSFEYNGYKYYKDRGYAFEESLNENTEGVLDMRLKDYGEPERKADIPLLIMSPTIVNDGRKLYISSQPISYMSAPDSVTKKYLTRMVKGIEFRRFFEEQKSGDLRFLSALRMSATFPYITPNVSLPSEPEMEIMDAGLSDNFGINDAVRFLYVFREWIAKNTSGVVFLSIRDSPKNFVIEAKEKPSLFQKFFTPVSSIYGNWQTMQDYNNDTSIEFARSWFKGPVNRIDIQYAPQLLGIEEEKLNQKAVDSLQLKYLQKRASLSWRLTEREKQSLKETIYEDRNQQSVKALETLLK